MKKLLAAIIMMVLLFECTTPVYAKGFVPYKERKEELVEYIDDNGIYFTPVYEQEKWSSFEEMAQTAEKFAIEYYEKTGECLTWVTESEENHQKMRVGFFSGTSKNEIQNLLSLDGDLVQFGCILDDRSAKEAKRAFEENSLMAGVDYVTLLRTQKEVVFESTYKFYASRNIPVYWNIEKHGDETYSLEVALGKYVIQPGDTLTKIAQKFKTTPEKLMKENMNIKNPDMIYAGDYLVIFSESLFEEEN